MFFGNSCVMNRFVRNLTSLSDVSDLWVVSLRFKGDENRFGQLYCLYEMFLVMLRFRFWVQEFARTFNWTTIVSCVECLWLRAVNNHRLFRYFLTLGLVLKCMRIMWLLVGLPSEFLFFVMQFLKNLLCNMSLSVQRVRSGLRNSSFTEW